MPLNQIPPISTKVVPQNNLLKAKDISSNDNSSNNPVKPGMLKFAFNKTKQQTDDKLIKSNENHKRSNDGWFVTIEPSAFPDKLANKIDNVVNNFPSNNNNKSQVTNSLTR